MIKTTSMLLEELHAYASPKTKLSRMVRRGECYPIIQGLYETERHVPAYLLAGSIYGPSYISFDFALSRYGLIPEAVYVVTCATFEKKKKKCFTTGFGTFTYRDVPSEVFPLGLKLEKEGDYWYRIACPEKALCDKLYTMPPISNTAELAALLLEGLRMEEDELAKLDLELVATLSEHYHSTNVRKLVTFLRRLKK